VATIEDVSPTLSNMSRRKHSQFPSGRMLSVDSSDDGRLVFAGSFSSNLWKSEDGGGHGRSSGRRSRTAVSSGCRVRSAGTP
jgi:hypothetical protein